MTSTRLCTTCSEAVPANSPEGICPRCLVGVALSPVNFQAAASGPFQPPDVETLNSQFEELEILELEGSGGMGAVYRARQTRLDRIVAVKILAHERASDVLFAERFLREARALARLSHPHIVAVYDAGQTSDFLYIVMEYVDGASLRALIGDGRLSPAEAMRLVPQICDAMQYAHDQGVIHRDIKPENILIDGLGRAKIADFGLAKFSQPEASQEFSLTSADVRMGTPSYMAPEQRANTAAVDHRADIYSLGMMFYEMLTGELPTVDYQPPSQKSEVDPRVDRVVQRSIKTLPDERYQQAAEVKHDVERIASSPIRFLSKVGGWPVLLGVLVLGVVFAAWGAVSQRSTSRAVDETPAPTATPAAENASKVHVPPAEILTSPNWQWAEPKNLGSIVNSRANDGHPMLSADGLTLVFHSNRRGGSGSFDLWQSTRKSPEESWSEPENLGTDVNTDAEEISPCMSPNGEELFFTRQAGDARKLWAARRPNASTPWDGSRLLTKQINATGKEGGASISTDARTLWFHRAGGPESRHEIWNTTRAGLYARLKSPVKQELRGFENRNASNPCISSDGRVLLWNTQAAAETDPALLEDLWMAVRATPDDPFGEPQSLGKVVNSTFHEMAPCLSSDGQVLIFNSDRPGGQGNEDLWMSHRVPK